jgi:hypothetical protein
MKKLTTEDFISVSNLKHGNVYDYSKTLYKNRRSLITIICKTHGEFEQQAGSHMYGKGCSICANNLPNSTENFIKKAIQVHGDIYDYSKVNYLSAHKKITITCRKHGEFLQTPSSHYKGNGCNKCFRNRLGDLKRKPIENFIKQCNIIHKGKYDYSKVKYFRNSEKIEIVCKEHGSFWQTGNNHLDGHGCPKCISIISKPEIELQEFIKSLGYGIIVNNRKILVGKELDIFIPELNKAIEFNGDYWHYSEKYFIPGKHAEKSNLCRQKNIKLLHIREDLWVKNKEKMKSITTKFLING